MHRADKYIEINAPIERVFDFFCDFENIPRWMDNIKSVEQQGRRYSHWIAEAPFGNDVEWDTQLIDYQQDRRVVWRSIDGDVDTECEATFEKTRRNTTLLHVGLGYERI